MAHADTIGRLTDELVNLVTGLTSKQNAEHFKRCQDFVLEALKHPYARTNQFEVTARLDGLEEKFRVLNNDSLADALRDRVTEVGQAPYNWTPEVLSLFLQLSARPAQKSNVEDLDLLKPPEPPRPLTWSDILADDPLDNEQGVWSSVDFAANDSEDEGSIVTPESSAQVSDASSLSPASNTDSPLLQAYIVPEDDTSLEEVVGAQFWRAKAGISQGSADGLHHTSKLDTLWQITELQAVREVLFMLSGLPTSLFSVDNRVNISVNMKYALRHSSQDTFNHVLHSYALIGTKLTRVRRWTSKKQKVALMQTFQAATEQRLRDLNKTLSKMQTRLVAPQQEVVVSLLALHRDVQITARSLLQLADLISELDKASKHEPFRALELLFDQTSLPSLRR